MNNKKIQFLTDSSESSDTESIGDELNLNLLKSVEDDKQLLIQKIR